MKAKNIKEDKYEVQVKRIENCTKKVQDLYRMLTSDLIPKALIKDRIKKLEKKRSNECGKITYNGVKCESPAIIEGRIKELKRLLGRMVDMRIIQQQGEWRNCSNGSTRDTTSAHPEGSRSTASS